MSKEPCTQPCWVEKICINFMHKIMQSYSLFTVSLCFLIKVEEEEDEDNTRKNKEIRLRVGWESEKAMFLNFRGS